MSVNMSVKFRKFQKILICLMLCLTSSGAPIGDVIVVFSTHSISKKSHETTRPNSETLNIIVL